MEGRVPEGPTPGAVLGGHGGPAHAADAPASGDLFRDRAVSPLTGEPSGAPFYNSYELPTVGGRRMPRISRIDHPGGAADHGGHGGPRHSIARATGPHHHEDGGGERKRRTSVTSTGDSQQPAGGGGGSGGQPPRALRSSVAGRGSTYHDGAHPHQHAHPQAHAHAPHARSSQLGDPGWGPEGAHRRQARTSVTKGGAYGGAHGGGGRPGTPDSAEAEERAAGRGGAFGHFKAHVPSAPGFQERLRVLSLALAELCRQESVHSVDRARLLARVWNDAVATYDDELRRLRLRAALAEEMAHSCAAHRQAALRSQKAAERDARAVRKAMLGMAMEEEEPAKLRMRIRDLEELEARLLEGPEGRNGSHA